MSLAIVLYIDKIDQKKKQQENSDETKWHWHKGKSNAFDMCTRKIQPMLKFLIAHFNSIKKISRLNTSDISLQSDEHETEPMYT